jgi:polyferredoxin/formate hydrogenlyase subunit 6/NADH:ubiquinone oxidoreductase subunit I
MVWIRRISQTFFLLLFIFLLVESRLPQAIYVDYSAAFTHEQDLRLSQPVTFFFHLDPLVWLTSLLSGHAWIKGFAWGMGVLVLTLFLGRVFCGFICPFGTLHHAVSRFRPALKGTRLVQATQKSSSQRFKYFLLVALLVSCLLGLNLTGLMDPIAFLFRSVTLAILPGVGVGIRTLFDLMAKSHIKDLNLLSYGAEVLVSPVFGYSYKAFQAGWLIGFLFLVILFLNRIRPRFWCRILCPLGALLGIFSRFSLLKLQKDPEKCTHCKLCTQTCQGGASPMPGQQWESAECLWCFNCFHACPEDALGFGLKWSPRVNKTPDMGRRVVLGGLLVGISLPLLGRLDGRIYKTSDPRLIRPPGSLPEEGFLTLCQRCGLCMKVCPTNVINPTLSEAGMAGFWTPRLVMTQGYCEYSCTLCGSVCPTGAIKEITAQDKTGLPIRIGSAYVNRGRCLPWSGNAPCIVCEEHCPTSPKAIYLQDAVLPGPGGKRLRVQLPYVDLRRCVGCGVCEYKCPVKGRPAIQIIAVGESRSVKNKILLSPT